MGAKIIGTGSYVPDKVLTNADLEKMVETSDEWIKTRTGIEERHIAASDQATSDLAYNAAVRALDMAGISGEELNGIIVASVTPDHVFPNTACILQKRLGSKGAFCFDLEAACSGLLYSIEVARSLMTTNKNIKYMLIIGGEKLSAITDWSDRNTCVLFGDGAAAVILENCSEDDCSIVSSSLGADGDYTDILCLPAGGSRNPASAETVAGHQHFIKMAGKDVFKLAVGAMVGACRKVLTDSGVDASQINWLVPHQANYRILTAVAQRLDITEEHVYVNVNRYGNTSAASIGICLDEMVRQNLIKKGDYVLLTAFGGGLTWGAMLLKW